MEITDSEVAEIRMRLSQIRAALQDDLQISGNKALDRIEAILNDAGMREFGI